MLALSSVSFASCSYLDFDETNGMKTKEDMYKYFGSAESMLTHVYSYMPQDFGTIDGAMRDCASDDAEYGNTEGLVQIFNNGNWSAVRTADDAFNLYKGIRAANGFIEEIADADFSRFEHDGNYANLMKKLKYFSYEARVLRAHYFFELARRYGDIAMPLSVLNSEGSNTISKTKFSDVIDFISAECDSCANVLPLTYKDEPDKQIGRVTKGFALAVKSKALLYRASALHNPENDKELWKQSALAAQAIIDLNVYQIDSKETANNVDSKEAVLLRMNSENNNFELKNFPIRFTEGSRTGNVATATFPTQNLVDAFLTKKGFPVKLTKFGWESEDPNFNPKQPYENRDPRFYRAILANGMDFKGQMIETFEGGKDDASIIQGGTPTGYFLRKYIQESTSFTPENTKSNKHHWVVYRYAETLLAYAESMANAFPDDIEYRDNIYKYSAKWAFNQLRVGVGMPQLETVVAYDEFMDILRNEWRVEFAFEDHRFWDIRRWNIGNQTQRNIYGVKIFKDNEGNLNYKRIGIEKRNWRNCMNLYPIPQEELLKNSNLNPQNLGW